MSTEAIHTFRNKGACRQVRERFAEVCTFRQQHSITLHDDWSLTSMPNCSHMLYSTRGIIKGQAAPTTAHVMRMQVLLQRSHIDDESISHIAPKDPFVGFVDLMDGNHLNI